MSAHLLNSLDRDPNDAIGRCVRWFENAHDHIFLLVRMFLGEIQPVIRMEPGTVIQSELARCETSNHCLAQTGIKESPGFSDGVTLARCILRALEQVRDIPDNTVTAE